jgi:hypothetical protein
MYHIQVLRGTARLSLCQAGRSEFKRSDLRQPRQRRGWRRLRPHQVTQPQRQRRLIYEIPSATPRPQPPRGADENRSRPSTSRSFLIPRVLGPRAAPLWRSRPKRPPGVFWAALSETPHRPAPRQVSIAALAQMIEGTPLRPAATTSARTRGDPEQNVDPDRKGPCYRPPKGVWCGSHDWDTRQRSRFEGR